ncbi:MAG: hypothetical protein NVSMB9_17900 [Isosphaeraceae bacterium]
MSLRSLPSVLGYVLLSMPLPPCDSGNHPPPRSSDQPRDSNSPSKRLVESLLEAHNRERRQAKLPSLTLEPKLTSAALAHAKDMAEQRKMAHEGSDGSTPFDRIKRQGYRFQSAAENVAQGQRTVKEVMRAWMNSPHHRVNILGAYSEVGIAMVRDDEGDPFWCVNFGTPWPSLDADDAADALVEALNKDRSLAGRSTLKRNSKLDSASMEIAGTLARQEAEPDKAGIPDLVQALKKTGYQFRKVSEAVAVGQSDAQEVVKSWKKDPSQRAALLEDFTEVGVGYASAHSGRPFWCVILARPPKD